MGTIAHQLHIHHSVVRRVLAQAGLPRASEHASEGRATTKCFVKDRRVSAVHSSDAWRAFPTLTASRLYVMAYERGYRGSPDHFRHRDCLSPAAAESRGVSTSAHAAARTGTNRPGTLRPPRQSAVHGVR